METQEFSYDRDLMPFQKEAKIYFGENQTFFIEEDVSLLVWQELIDLCSLSSLLLNTLDHITGESKEACLSMVSRLQHNMDTFESVFREKGYHMGTIPYPKYVELNMQSKGVIPCYQTIAYKGFGFFETFGHKAGEVKEIALHAYMFHLLTKHQKSERFMLTLSKVFEKIPVFLKQLDETMGLLKHSDLLLRRTTYLFGLCIIEYGYRIAD